MLLNVQYLLLLFIYVIDHTMNSYHTFQ